LQVCGFVIKDRPIGCHVVASRIFFENKWAKKFVWVLCPFSSYSILYHHTSRKHGSEYHQWGPWGNVP
jgi:hypothetical protein